MINLQKKAVGRDFLATGTTMIEQLIELGKNIESKCKVSDDSFVPTCFKTLESFTPTLDLATFDKELANWMLSTELPEQLNVYNAFGQPPVTVFNNGEFVVDLYFWLHSDTSIHTHSFSGAFKVLYGQSLHEIYTVKEKQAYTKDVGMTELKRESIALLEAGDSHTIKAGEEFCHRVVHLKSPTVTLCIRSITDKNVPQWHYFENGLRILKRDLTEAIYKKLFYFEYLYLQNPQQATEFCTRYINNLDDSEVINLFEQLSIDSMGLSDESMEVLYDIIMSQYAELEWFKIYDRACHDANEVELPLNDSPRAYFLAHAKNTCYPKELINELVKKI
jgi:hypothetical protein